MVDTAHSHAVHEPPSGFIRKYIFSKDHKVIGIQYYHAGVVLGLRGDGVVGAHPPQSGVGGNEVQFSRDSVPRRRTRGCHDAGVLSGHVDHARNHDGFHGFDHSAAGRLRKLLPADSDRCPGHGVPNPEHAFLLVHVPVAGCSAGGVFRSRGTAHVGLDRLCPLECAR